MTSCVSVELLTPGLPGTYRTTHWPVVRGCWHLLALGLGWALLLSSFIGCMVPLSTGPCRSCCPQLYQFVPTLLGGNTGHGSCRIPSGLSFHGETTSHADRWGQALCWESGLLLSCPLIFQGQSSPPLPPRGTQSFLV